MDDPSKKMEEGMREVSRNSEKDVDPGGPKEILRKLYLPWNYLVFMPMLGLLTLVFGGSSMIVPGLVPRQRQQFGRVWGRLLCWINFTRVKVTGKKNVVRGQSYVIMCNHQSHFDVVALLGHWVSGFSWVIKQELRKIPVFGAACEKMGHIFIDRSDRDKAVASLNEARKQLSGGACVMFFPEGTRSRDGRMRPFKKGGFVMAMEMGLPILPVSITGSRHVLPARSLGLLPGKIEIKIHPPVDTSLYGMDDKDKLMADVRAVIASGLPPYERGE